MTAPNQRRRDEQLAPGLDEQASVDATDAVGNDVTAPRAEQAEPDPAGHDVASEPAAAAADELIADADDLPDWPALAEQDPRSRTELFTELHATQAQRDEYLDDLRRARAEFENYRRRTARDGVVQREAGRADIAESLLEALDDLDRTLEAAQASADETLAKGVELVASKVRATLESKGLSRVDDIGVTFDPSQHEAVQHRQADEPREEPTVVEVFRPGYRFGDRVLRPAMVVVEG